MPRIRKAGQLAPVGSVGNNTHPSVAVPADADSVSLEFEITAIGATPQITYKYQGSQDDGGTSDAASDWFDLFVDPDDGSASAITFVKNPAVVGVFEYTLEMARKPVTKIRLVTSANTNTTYESELFSSADV